MAKVLKITKPDKTIHVVPITNKGFYQSFNRRQKADKKWKVEEIDEKDAKDLPFVDESHVSPMEAVKKLDDANARIAELEALLAEKGADNTGNPAPVVELKAADKIELIKVATTADQVNEILGTDGRATVVAAATKRIAELEAK